MSKSLPSFNYEQKLWNKGIGIVAGADEVGRGCFAGPIVTACVGFNSGTTVPEGVHINDSKKLTHLQRKKASIWIKDRATILGIGESSVDEINKLGIVEAANLAFCRAVNDASGPGSIIEHLLVDAFYVNKLDTLPKERQTPISKGDNISVSIAAASVIAKVYRDEMMERIAQNDVFAPYRWEKNKGYGTKEHREAIVNLGITKYHRVKFVETFLSKIK